MSGPCAYHQKGEAGTYLLETELVRTFRNQDGLLQAVGTFPCTYSRDKPHPVASIASRRIARFRRHLQGGIELWKSRGRALTYVVVAVRTKDGRPVVNLRYATQRFIQKLRRKGLALEYLRVVEPNGAGITNHANLVIASKGELPSKHELKDTWAASTYGTSYELESAQVQDVGMLSRYLSKFLGSYLSKSFEGRGEATGEGGNPAEGGLDSRYQNATRATRVTDYVTTSRNWLPVGAEKEWKRLFVECAVIWLCDRGFFHTDLRDTTERWLEWVVLTGPRRGSGGTEGAPGMRTSKQEVIA